MRNKYYNLPIIIITAYEFISYKDVDKILIAEQTIFSSFTSFGYNFLPHHFKEIMPKIES